MLMTFNFSKFECGYFAMPSFWSKEKKTQKKQRKNTFFFSEKSALTEFSTNSLYACERRGAPDWKNTQKDEISEETEFLKYRIFPKTVNFWNSYKASSILLVDH